MRCAFDSLGPTGLKVFRLVLCCSEEMSVVSIVFVEFLITDSFWEVCSDEI